MAPFFDSNGDPTISPYEVLGLPTNASETDIKKAYRTQMLQLHPDKLSPNLDEQEIAAVTDKFHNVKDAYEFLIAPQYLTARRLYQVKMASRRAEFERREAFMRRAGCNASGIYTQQASQYAQQASQYAQQSSQYAQQAASHHARTTSYSMPARGEADHNRSKSEPRVNPVPGGRRTAPPGMGQPPGMPGMGQPRYYKSTVGGGAYNNNSYGNPYRDTARDAAPSPTGTTRRARDINREKEAFREKMAHQQPRRSSQKTGEARRTTTNTAARKTERGRTTTTNDNRNNRAKSEPRSRHRRNEAANSSGSSNSGDEDYRGSRDSSDNNARKTSKNNTTTRTTTAGAGVRVNKRRRAKSAPARCAYGRRRQSANFGGSSGEREKEKEKLPKEFYCPLTKRVMKDPVMDTDGNTYEREAIERWLRVQSSSPITNGYLSLDQLKPNKELKNKIYKVTGKPRSKSCPRSRSKSRSSSPSHVSGRVLIDSYLREISRKSKLSVCLDGMGICAFSYRRLTFVIEVPITPGAGFMVYSSFDAHSDKEITEKIDAWNKWLGAIGWGSRVSYANVGNKGVFTLKGNERDMMKCEVFQKTLEYFVEMSLKLHNLLHPTEVKSVDNVCLTRAPVCVA